MADYFLIVAPAEEIVRRIGDRLHNLTVEELAPISVAMAESVFQSNPKKAAALRDRMTKSGKLFGMMGVLSLLDILLEIQFVEAEQWLAESLLFCVEVLEAPISFQDVGEHEM